MKSRHTCHATAHSTTVDYLCTYAPFNDGMVTDNNTHYCTLMPLSRWQVIYTPSTCLEHDDKAFCICSLCQRCCHSLSVSLLLTRPNPPPFAVNALSNPKTLIKSNKAKGNANTAINSVISFPNRRNKEEKEKSGGDGAWWTGNGLRQILSKTNIDCEKDTAAAPK